MGTHSTDSNQLVQHGFLNLRGPNENIFFTALLKSKIQVACQVTIRHVGQVEGCLDQV